MLTKALGCSWGMCTPLDCASDIFFISIILSLALSFYFFIMCLRLETVLSSFLMRSLFEFVALRVLVVNDLTSFSSDLTDLKARFPNPLPLAFPKDFAPFWLCFLPSASTSARFCSSMLMGEVSVYAAWVISPSFSCVEYMLMALEWAARQNTTSPV